MTEKIKTPWGTMSLRKAALRAGVLPQTFWYRYQQGYNKDQLFAPTVGRAPARLTDHELISELRTRGYKVEKKATKKKS